MDITLEYAIVAGGILLLLFLANLLRQTLPIIRYIGRRASKHLTYAYLLHRHRYLGPWTRAQVLAQLAYAAANLFCLCFHVSSTQEVGKRAESMALINAMPLFASPHISMLSDSLGVSLATVRQMHCSAGIMTSTLILVHILFTLAATPSFDLHISRNLFAVIGASSLCLTLLLSYPPIRRLSYELFLRGHQALAILFLYSLWRHLPSGTTFPRAYLYIATALFSLSSLTQCGLIAFRNGIITHRRARADVSHHHGVVRVRIYLEKPVRTQAGQHVNLWIPSVSFWSFTQSHPFVVISWADEPQKTLDLFVEPRRGLTRELLHHAESPHASSPLVLFSGPHGWSVAVDEYESVLMIAGGFGIAAQLPYLKRLIHGHNAREVRARRILLVWEIRNIEVGLAAEPLLNGALKEDKMDADRILAISIYWESNDAKRMPFGKHANMFSGRAPLKDIFREEVSGQHMKKPQMVADWDEKHLTEKELEAGAMEVNGRRGKMLVMASATDEARDELRMLVRDYVMDRVKLVELDYQPS